MRGTVERVTLKNTTAAQNSTVPSLKNHVRTFFLYDIMTFLYYLMFSHNVFIVGVTIASPLQWNCDIHEVIRKANKRIYFLILPVFHYALPERPWEQG